MGFMSGKANYTRYRVTVDESCLQGLPFNVWLLRGLDMGRFKELMEDAEKEALGFTAFFTPTISISPEYDPSVGEYAHWWFREDHRRVPASALRMAVQGKVEDYRKENNHWPTLRERHELREEAESALLRRAIPTTGGCAVVWNLATEVMRIGTASSRMQDTVLNHIQKHFLLQILPVPIEGYERARMLLGGEPQMIAALSGMYGPVVGTNATSIIGLEFLTWLWWLGGSASLQDGRPVEIHAGERSEWCERFDGRDRIACTSGCDAETAAAFECGKLILSAEYEMKVGENEYSFRLDGSLVGVRGLTTPRILRDRKQKDDELAEEGWFLERMGLLDEFDQAVDALYLEFLRLHLDKGAWVEQRKAMSEAAANAVEAFDAEGSES